MNTTTRSALGLLGTAVAALAGTLVGNGARTLVSAKREGRTEEVTITGSLSSAVTATLLARKAESAQPLVAFAIGAVLGGVLGDQGDRWIASAITSFRSTLSHDKETGNPEGGAEKEGRGVQGS